MKTQSTAYRLRNWRDYNASLTRRGSLTLWIEEDVVQWWLAPQMSQVSQEPRKPGAVLTYSDKAIEACLSLRVLLNLPLRQAELAAAAARRVCALRVVFGRSVFARARLYDTVPPT